MAQVPQKVYIKYGDLVKLVPVIIFIFDVFYIKFGFIDMNAFLYIW